MPDPRCGCSLHGNNELSNCKWRITWMCTQKAVSDCRPVGCHCSTPPHPSSKSVSCWCHHQTAFGHEMHWKRNMVLRASTLIFTGYSASAKLRASRGVEHVLKWPWTFGQYATAKASDKHQSLEVLLKLSLRVHANPGSL